MSSLWMRKLSLTAFGQLITLYMNLRDQVGIVGPLDPLLLHHHSEIAENFLLLRQGEHHSLNWDIHDLPQVFYEVFRARLINANPYDLSPLVETAHQGFQVANYASIFRAEFKLLDEERLKLLLRFGEDYDDGVVMLLAEVDSDVRSSKCGLVRFGWQIRS